MHLRDVQQEVSRQIDRHEIKDIILLGFTKAQSASLKWEHPGEFEFDGVMYDIVCKEICGDNYWYWCYKDIKETKLRSQLQQFIAHALGQPQSMKDQGIQLSHFFKNLFCKADTVASFSIFPGSAKGGAYVNHIIYNFLKSPPSPPPEIFII